MGIPQREVSGVETTGEKLEPGYLQLGKVVMIEPDEPRWKKEQPRVNGVQKQEKTRGDCGPPD